MHDKNLWNQTTRWKNACKFPSSAHLRMKVELRSEGRGQVGCSSKVGNGGSLTHNKVNAEP